LRPGHLAQVNTGELLRSITNDTWLATRHYALHPPAAGGEGGGGRRFSIPFFFNATADFRQAVVPTTVSADRPAKYPPGSNRQGVQGAHWASFLNPMGLFLRTSIPCVWRILSVILPA
jgi:isopenicillin N synthase-like dioxygenase